MRLKDKVAIVTGSSRGIGKALAIEYGREGADVVVTARSEKKGPLPGTIYETEDQIKQLGVRAMALKCDVSDEEQVQAMVSAVIEAFGRVDILVNNAAVGYYKSLMETPLKHWDLVMKVNVRGPFICTKTVLPFMVKQGGGSILNISSSAAGEAYSRMQRKKGQKRLVGTAYGASKAALERFTIGLAAEVKAFNIAVNALKPTMPTFSEGVAFWNPDIRKSDLVPPTRYMTKGAVFLAAQEASDITGGIFYDQELCEAYGLVGETE
jgi:NAD(P)-dependent dehydrogenase (short-subunit alcohol dehydrogenase family)